MTDTEVLWLDVRELARRICTREVSSLEATELAIQRAETVGAELRAFVTVAADAARREAERADRAVAEGKPLGALHGVPITIKDLMSTRGMPTTAGSRAPRLGYSSRRDAPVVRRLRRAGAVILGKTNLNEFAYGVTGENAHFGDVPNPWARGRISGGSSSGSAAALAAGIGYGSVGTDTRGSIRIPAACCGISGIKPTRGLVPTAEVFPLSWTLDHVGPMARSAADLATLLGAMTTARTAGRFAAALDRPLRGVRVGVCPFFFENLRDEVARAVDAATQVLVGEGAELIDVDLPELGDSLKASAVIAGSEGLAVHDQRLREGADGYGAPVLGRLESAYAYTGVDLAQALTVRRGLVDAYRRAFRQVDCMVGPTLPGVAAPMGSSVMPLGGDREEGIVNASVRLVAPQNMTGVPAASVPCGFSSDGLPIGLQIWAAAGADDVVLSVAHRFQSVTDWHTRHPGPA